MGAIRENFLICMIGTNGTGKTSVTKEIIRKWKTSRPQNKCIIFDSFGQMDILADFRIKRNANWAKTIDEKVRDSLIVLDDYKILVETYTPTEGMKDLFINRRHHNNDYIYSCHTPSDVLPGIVAFTSHFYIFYTKSLQGIFKDRLPFSDLLIAASSYVNKYVSLYGKGKHHLDPTYEGQGFPYCIVNTNDQTVQAMNMKKKLVIN